MYSGRSGSCRLEISCYGRIYVNMFCLTYVVWPFWFVSFRDQLLRSYIRKYVLSHLCSLAVLAGVV